MGSQIYKYTRVSYYSVVFFVCGYFQVSSRTDSRTILDANGSERLLGNGDMLFLPPGTGRLQRIQGAYISEEEIARVTAFLRKQ